MPESRQAFEVATAQTSELVNLVFSRQTGFSRDSICLLNTTDGPITEPAVPRAQLLGLGSKLDPSNMQRILNKDPRFLIFNTSQKR